MKTKVVLPTPMSHTDIRDEVDRHESHRKRQQLPTDGYEFKTVKKPTLMHKIHAVLVELMGKLICHITIVILKK